MSRQSGGGLGSCSGLTKTSLFLCGGGVCHVAEPQPARAPLTELGERGEEEHNFCTPEAGWTAGKSRAKVQAQTGSGK